MFFPYIPSCEAHKQFGAEPAQYGLEINFKAQKDLSNWKNYHLNFSTFHLQTLLKADN